MTTQVEVAADLLFPSAGNPVAANIKFCAGWHRVVCAEELAAEFLRVETLIGEGGIQSSDGIDD
jgi:hypothetical protein